MNSLGSDLRRAIFSRGFLASLFAQLSILLCFGAEPRALLVSIPVVCTFPYSCAFLTEYRGGFVRSVLYRTSFREYILGKFLAAGISGGLTLVISLRLWTLMSRSPSPICEKLLFLNGFLWAVVSATLASASQSRYIAYGSSFTVCYFLVILCERYFPSICVIDPTQWIAPDQSLYFGEDEAALILILLSAAVMMIYYLILRRKLQNV